MRDQRCGRAPRNRPPRRPSQLRHRYRLNAKIDWKALSKRIGHADVAFTMNQYVQTDLEADRQVANTLAELIIGGALASFEIPRRMGGKASGEGCGEAA